MGTMQLTEEKAAKRAKSNAKSTLSFAADDEEEDVEEVCHL